LYPEDRKGSNVEFTCEYAGMAVKRTIARKAIKEVLIVGSREG
jgi:hypothetical protein